MEDNRRNSAKLISVKQQGRNRDGREHAVVINCQETTWNDQDAVLLRARSRCAPGFVRPRVWFRCSRPQPDPPCFPVRRFREDRVRFGRARCERVACPAAGNRLARKVESSPWWMNRRPGNGERFRALGMTESPGCRVWPRSGQSHLRDRPCVSPGNRWDRCLRPPVQRYRFRNA